MIALMDDLYRRAVEKGVVPDRFILGENVVGQLLNDCSRWSSVEEGKCKAHPEEDGFVGEFKGIPVYNDDDMLDRLELECSLVIGHGYYSGSRK